MTWPRHFSGKEPLGAGVVAYRYDSSCPAIPLLTQLPADGLGEAVEDSSTVWASAVCVEDLDEAPDSWVWFGHKGSKPRDGR